MTAPIIDHIVQPTDDTCTSACLAMMLKMDVLKVIQGFYDKHKSGDADATMYLDLTGLHYRKCYSNETDLEPGYVYLLAVPSLNEEGMLHNIVVDCVQEGWYILDPNDGKPDKLSYLSMENQQDIPEGYRQLKGWMAEIEINRKELQTYWRKRDET